MTTLSCFTYAEFQVAHRLLAARVATMMGRKLEEEDWRQAYSGAKGIPDTGWSNLQIDIMHGELGVEHKMLCVRSRESILTECGTNHMHPSATRSIRIPNEDDATAAARIVLQQYADLIAQRTRVVDLRNRVAVGQVARPQAIAEIAEALGIAPAAAERQIPEVAAAQGGTQAVPPDMRFGWLLWQESLREFLYFEEPMTPPDPTKYRAVWNDRRGGTRKASRNLWVYEEATGRKAYSITTEAGAKIQPYFDVPAPDDPNLYHFVVQGEPVSDGLVRVWATEQTAAVLRRRVGSLSPTDLSDAILAACSAYDPDSPENAMPGDNVIELMITSDAYAALVQTFEGVSDEHLLQLCARALSDT